MLTIDPQKVKEAAAKCSTAAEILKTLFPEVFEENVVISVASGSHGFSEDVIAFDKAKNWFLITIGSCKAFRLSPLYEWNIIPGKDNFYNSGAGEILLIPTLKK